MVSRAFSIEDGNLQQSKITVARTRKYKDIDLTFAKKPNGDIYKKQDAAAVKQSVKNILMTNFAERPFLPNFGANLNDFLFNLDTEFDDDLLEQSIIDSIDAYEPRVRVLNVKVSTLSDFNSVRVTVTFRIISTSETLSINLDLTRLR